ncbi:MAG TPA: hypothetical protein VIC55_00710, partial [Gemmatimonadaceae bacterium]
MNPPATSATPGSPTPAGKILGPADRITFFDEQARNRRQSWRFSTLAMLTVLATSVPVSIIVTPYIYVFLLLTGHIANAIRPLDPATIKQLHDLAYMLPEAVARIAQTKSLAGAPHLIVPALVLVLPGAAVMLALWVAIRLTFRNSGVGGALAAAGRAPRPEDPAEQRLVNLVEEMAIAGGVPPPRLIVIDSPAANVAATGSSLRSGAIVATRGFVDLLNREQAEAMIGHVIGAMGNGDLEIAQSILGVYRTFGLLELVLDTSFGPQSRDAIWRLFKLAFTARGSVEEVREADALAELLERSAMGSGAESLGQTAGQARARQRGAIASLLDAPRAFFLTLPMATAQFTIGLASTLFFGPAFAALWRARCRLADASAVQLTRNPESVASGLECLGMAQTAVFGGEASSFLFVTWQGTATSVRGKAVSTPFSSFQPAVKRRMKRLVKQGARLREGRPLSRGSWIVMIGFALILGPLMLVALGLSLAALAMMMMLDI